MIPFGGDLGAFFTAHLLYFYTVSRALLALGKLWLGFWILPDPGFSYDWPWALPAACQPGLYQPGLVRGGPGGLPPAQKKRPLPLPPSLSAALRPSSLALSLSLSFPFPPSAALSLAPVLADPPYPAGGPSLPGRRTPLTRQADPPYPTGGRRTLLPYLPPGGRRMPDTPKLLGRRILLTRKADTPYSEGGYSLLGGQILVCACLTPRSPTSIHTLPD